MEEQTERKKRQTETINKNELKQSQKGVRKEGRKGRKEGM